MDEIFPHVGGILDDTLCPATTHGPKPHLRDCQAQDIYLSVGRLQRSVAEFEKGSSLTFGGYHR
jgi:hypothetical protein